MRSLRPEGDHCTLGYFLIVNIKSCGIASSHVIRARAAGVHIPPTGIVRIHIAPTDIAGIHITSIDIAGIHVGKTRTHRTVIYSALNISARIEIADIAIAVIHIAMGDCAMSDMAAT